MTALNLNPFDNNYLTCRLINEQLTDNKESLTLSSNVVANISGQTPNVVLDGTGRAYLEGAISIGGSPAANYPLFTLPSNLVPTKDCFIPVVVWRAGAYVPNAISIQTAGSAITGATVTAAGSYATLPTLLVAGDGVGASLSPIMKAVTIQITTAQSGVGSYAPNDFVQLAGGTFATRGIAKVTHTLVASATVDTGGSGGTNGAQVVSGTTGTGTKFQASVTISGGAITAVNSITVPGDYTVNPTSLTAEPVTGAGLTGATLNVKMGILTAIPDTAGSYTVLPTDPVGQFATSGSGTGAQFTVLWGILGADVTNAGQGYTAGSTTISITGGGGTGGGALTPTFSVEASGQVSLVTQPNLSDVVYLDGVNFLVEPYR